MTTILCPTRGGKASYLNQDRAITLAHQRGAEVLFLYVTNLQFLNRIASPVVVDVAHEIDEMGEFLLLMAKERAAKAGVEARTIVKRGVFEEVLREVIEAEDISAVVVGSARKDSGVTTADYLERLAEQFADEYHLEFFLVDEGDVASMAKPKTSSQE